jgi:uncharacterized phiE125 gp8 family phage protein
MSDVQSVAPTTVALTLKEAKDHLNVSSTNDDSLIQDYVSAATQLLEKRTNRAFVHQTRVCKFQSFTDSRYVRDQDIYLKMSPLSSVTSLVYVNASGTTTTMPTSDYTVMSNSRPGRISEAYNASWPGTRGHPEDVTITYVAGHSSASTGVPQNVKHAIRMLVGHWYRNREHVLVGTISGEVAMSIDALLESEQIETYG